jgi:hypothetical protein
MPSFSLGGTRLTPSGPSERHNAQTNEAADVDMDGRSQSPAPATP